MSTPEKVVENSILEWLNTQPGVLAFKVQTTGVYDPTKSTFRRAGKFVLKGTSDILLICDGVFGAMEVKAPGKKKNVSPDQQAFINKVVKCGGVAGVVDCIEDAQSLLTEMRNLCQIYLGPNQSKSTH